MAAPPLKFDTNLLRESDVCCVMPCLYICVSLYMHVYVLASRYIAVVGGCKRTSLVARASAAFTCIGAKSGRTWPEFRGL